MESEGPRFFSWLTCFESYKTFSQDIQREGHRIRQRVQVTWVEVELLTGMMSCLDVSYKLQGLQGGPRADRYK